MKRESEAQSRAQEKENDLPVITWEQFHDFLDLDTGRDSFFEFTGFVEEDGKRKLEDVYRVHSTFAELGTNRNFALTLQGYGSTLPEKKPLSEITQFFGYSIRATYNRPLKENLSSGSIQEGLVKPSESNEKPTVTTVPVISFDIKRDQALEQREKVKEFLRKFTREILEAKIAQARLLEGNSAEQVGSSEYEGLVKKHLETMKTLGIYRFYTDRGLVDLRDNHVFQV